MYVYKATGAAVHSSSTGSTFHTKYMVPGETFGRVQRFKVHQQAKTHKPIFSATAVCVMIQRATVTCLGFSLCLVAGQVGRAGSTSWHTLLVNIHEEPWLLTRTALKSRPGVT